MLHTDNLRRYLATHSYASFNLKAVLFDMDGVLFDSMPYHAQAWHQTMVNRGFAMTRAEAYLHEGRTGAGTINIIYGRELGREASPEEIKEIYNEKSCLFNEFPQAEAMPGAAELLKQLKADGLQTMVVTGSGQASLLDRLEQSFPHTFKRELMVTAFDVKHGKPHPEPYLMALEKGNLQPNEAIVVENAPLGVQAAVAAGIFTVAVNTGPLDDKMLLDAGADLLFASMNDLNEQWPRVYEAFGACRP